MSAQANIPTGQGFSNTLVELQLCQLEYTVGKKGAHGKKKSYSRAPFIDPTES